MAMRNIVTTLFIPSLILVCSTRAQEFGSDDEEVVQMSDVRNDSVTIHWHLPDDIANETTAQRLMMTVLRSSMMTTRTSFSVQVKPTARIYTFKNLEGNTTYRASVEAFQNDDSIWYASNEVTTSLASLEWLQPPGDVVILDKTDTSLEVTWTTPTANVANHAAVINQVLINVYEFIPHSKLLFKRASHSVTAPRTSFKITRLQPTSVYNITLQAGTSYGYGRTAWFMMSTLPENGEFILKIKKKTPNSLILMWSPKFIPPATTKFTVRAHTLHSPDNVEKEISETGSTEFGKSGEFALRHLHPASTYNVTLSTTIFESGSKYTKPEVRSTWSVFSTLPQGEYVVQEARVVVETNTAASIVFHPLKQLNAVLYQVRYSESGEKPIELTAYKEDELACPKFGCDWLCTLVFNLPKRAREYKFEIRAKVDGMWNKWQEVEKKPWNLMERVCSINPPTDFVANIGNEQFMREVDMASGLVSPQQHHGEISKYLVVVDSRNADFGSFDMTRLADKATADYDHVAYYVAAALSPKHVHSNLQFRLGDGNVYGGYLNYPLVDKRDPRWTLIPISQTENEIIEPRLKTCGFTEDGVFECEMTFRQFLSYVPWWFILIILFFVIAIILIACTLAICAFYRVVDPPNRVKERSVMYYENIAPNTTATTREYRKVETREFLPNEIEERMRFIEGL